MKGILKKVARKDCPNVEPEKAFADYNTVSEFIELVFMSMDDSSL